MSARIRDTSPFEVLRPLQRKLKAQQNHSHYVGNNNESLRLAQVVGAKPPEGGMTAYLTYLDAEEK
jgi:hypothetical protein